MVNLLHNVELDLHLRLFRAPTVAANFTLIFIVILRVRDVGVWKLHMSNLKVVLGVAGSMGTDEKAMGGVGLIRDPVETRVRTFLRIGIGSTDSCLSGNHWVVRVGHSRAVLRIMS